MKKLKVGIAGYGVVGKRRHYFIDTHSDLKLVGVCDKTFDEKKLSDEDGIKKFKNYEDLLNGCSLDILFVCLTNDVAAEVTIAGLKKGLHVFCEKPPGRSVDDIENVIKVENKNPTLKLKYGFNHRYHDSVKMARKLINSGEMGEVINIRGVYGKSKIVSYESSWRTERKIAGGGILLDQGIHMVDLINLFCSDFVEVKSIVSNSYWKYDVEDNAYAIMKDKNGRVAMLHSTATQWQHKFNLHIALTEGYIDLFGILSGSKSYGQEKIIIARRDKDSVNGQRETKTLNFLNDNSWRDEIFEFVEAIKKNKKIEFGNSMDALKTMKLVYAIYYNDEKWREKFNIKNPNLY